MILIGIGIYVFIMAGQDRIPIEELETINGIGYDILMKSEDMVEYILPLSVSEYKSNGLSINTVVKEKGNSIGEVIQKRQQKMNKRFVQGQERVIIISEEYAAQGLKTIIDDRFRNPEINDMAYMVVCKGKAENILKYKVKGYGSSSEYINGLVESSKYYNFYSDNYKIVDAYVRIGAEGRSLVLPYIEITDEGIKLTGLAAFKGYKMVAKTDEKNGKILSLLKSDDVKGVISIEKEQDKYIDYEGKTGKRKVKCKKDGDKYTFIIDIALKGNIVNNEMYKEITKDLAVKKDFEKAASKEMEESCYKFLKTMQNVYKIDCIGLGREGAATFGRHKNIDWDKAVSEGNIIVNVKVKVDLQGRGDY